MNSVEILGFVAGLMVAVSLLPQVIKSWTTRSTTDISLYWSLINLAGQGLWLVYGVMIQSAPLYIMSAITLVLALVMLIMKLKFDSERRAR